MVAKDGIRRVWRSRTLLNTQGTRRVFSRHARAASARARRPKLTTTHPTAPTYPAYPAAATVTGSRWHSALTRDGRVPLARPTITIGRMEDNDIVISDPLASRHHAVIRWAPGGYEIDDLGSVNGTTLQGQPINGRASLAPGQIVRIGATDISLQPLQPAEMGVAPVAGAPIARTTGPAPSGGEAATVRSPSPVALGQAPRQARPVTPSEVALAANAFGAVSGAQPYPSPYPFPYPYPASTQNPMLHGVRAFLRKRWWKFFLIGLLAYIVSLAVLLSTGIVNLIPLVLLLASVLAPVTFVIYCWEQNAFADMPAATVAITFMGGAVLGIILAAILEPLLLNVVGLGAIPFAGALVIGFCEETAKVIPVLWFLRDKRIRSELDGVILGAASGMGFAALETAGYGFQSFIAGYNQVLVPVLSQHSASSTTLSDAFTSGIINMNIELVLRMALAIFGHGVWTAIVCAAIWRYRQRSIFRQLGSILTAYLIAVLLHAAWDSAPQGQGGGFAVTLVWYLVVGITGILILRFFIWESLERAKLGPTAPPPRPLLIAMVVAFFDFFTPWRRRAQPQPAYGPYGPYAPIGQPGMYAAPGNLVQPGGYPAAPSAPYMAQPPQPPHGPAPMVVAAPAPGQAAANPPGQPKFCRSCGAPTQVGATSCARCGAPLG